MASVVIDDHLLRDILAGVRPADLGGLVTGRLATTGLWLFRLASSFADPTVTGKLSRPVAGLPADLQAKFRAQLTAIPPDMEVLSLQELAWAMAELQYRHRSLGHRLSAAMVEALAAASRLDAAIAVSRHDVGPNLQAAARADGIEYHIL